MALLRSNFWKHISTLNFRVKYGIKEAYLQTSFSQWHKIMSKLRLTYLLKTFHLLDRNSKKCAFKKNKNPLISAFEVNRAHDFCCISSHRIFKITIHHIAHRLIIKLLWKCNIKTRLWIFQIIKFHVKYH